MADAKHPMYVFQWVASFCNVLELCEWGAVNPGMNLTGSIDEDGTVVTELPPLLALDISGLASDKDSGTDDNSEDLVMTRGRGQINPTTTYHCNLDDFLLREPDRNRYRSQ